MINELTRICKVLNTLKMKYAVIGGIACILYGVDRTTMDIDILLNITGENDVRRLVVALRNAGYDVSVREAVSAFRKRNHFTALSPEGLRIDFKFSSSKLDYSTLENVVTIEFRGVKIRVGGLEENIVAKIVVLGSLKDLEDALKLMTMYFDRLDWTRMENLAGRNLLLIVKELLEHIEEEFKDMPNVILRIKQLRSMMESLRQKS